MSQLDDLIQKVRKEQGINTTGGSPKEKLHWGWVLFGAVFALGALWFSPPTQQGSLIKKGLPLSVEGSPVLGNPDAARVAIVQFSDYECPFCKQFHQEVFNRLVREYVDTNKALFVFKEFPLPGHNPMATDEARAAQCVAMVSDTATYVRYGDILFDRTRLNGQGIEGIAPEVLAEQSGADSGTFSSCLRQGRSQGQVATDIARGDALGISATPSFVIGRLENGQVTEGTLLVGNQPFSAFENILKRYLQ